MAVLIHVVIAISSMILSGAAFLNPSSAKLKTSYILIASTLASGTYLVLSVQASMLRTCVSGLVFLTVSSIVTYFSKEKLAQLATQESKDI